MSLPHRILPLLRGTAQSRFTPLYRITNPQLRYLATAPPTPPSPVKPAEKHSGDEPFKDLDPKDDTPPRLSRPIGLQHPPRPGENTGVDPRTWAERREDFVDWDKHLERRKKLTREFSKSYFADFSHISPSNKGKSFLSPPLLFKASKALFFPNLVGRTLASSTPQDTTPVLEGRVSVVAVFSTAWAEAQCKSFLDGLPLGSVEEGGVQRVDINVELNWMKAALVKLFTPSIRRRLPVEQHSRYFIVEKGLDDDTRQQIGFFNGRVGYVYLLDWDCKIRWAGSGNADDEEKAALRRGVLKLGEEWRKMEAERAGRPQKEVEKKEVKSTDEDDDF